MYIDVNSIIMMISHRKINEKSPERSETINEKAQYLEIQINISKTKDMKTKTSCPKPDLG